MPNWPDWPICVLPPFLQVQVNPWSADSDDSEAEEAFDAAARRGSSAGEYAACGVVVAGG